MASYTTRKFKVEYSKHVPGSFTKWESGFLIQSNQEGKAWVWLKNSDKVTLRKGSVNENFVSKLGSRETLTCAGYKIRVLKESESKAAPKADSLTSQSSNVAIAEPPKTSILPKVDSRSKPAMVNPSVPSQKAFLDPVLLRSMRSYQIEAASFLLNRLQDGRCSKKSSINSSSLNNGIPLTGAILADDMGTGKTLVGLAVLWALCRHGQGKGVIVCPSSLIQNWRKEINKWLPKTARTTIYITGGGQGGSKANDLNVHLFVSSAPSVHPLLVVSYDMFRIYAEAFNTIQTLHTILCDEGHRLKNAVGTKTSLALGNCIAMQRLVLTGTPIQNNLDELYAVVNFTVPGYLGTLDEFQRRFARVIEAANDPHALPQLLAKAEAARDILSEKLQTILIRRTGETLLRDVLPCRREFIVALSMQGTQKDQYMEAAHSLLNGVGATTTSHVDSTYHGGSELCNKRKSSCKDLSFGDDIMTAKPLPRALVLPALQRLRVLCSSGILEDEEAYASLDDEKSGSKRPRVDSEASSRPAQQLSHAGSIANFILNSSKLLVVYSILRCMKSAKLLKNEKLVIASNFISTLNTLEPIIKASGHQFLRIDGSVAAEQRQNIVDMFNNENSAFTVCLISVKAGGVGLNLIGANRLILFEPDYNPATDQQAIGRVWRVGQKKEVYIYRLLYASSIEESILGRQCHKNLLSTVITETKVNNDKMQQGREDRDEGRDEDREHSLTFDNSNYDISTQAPGVLLELILPAGEGSNEVLAPLATTLSNDDHVDYCDDILNELVSDEFVTCDIKVKLM